MDELLNIASKTMQNFNPATDTVDDFETVPDGEYECLLEEVSTKKSEKTGNNRIEFKFSVIKALDTDENYEGRLIFVNFFFSEKTMQRSVKGITKLAYEFGYELPLEAFSSYETLAETLNQMAGRQATVRQTTKKDFPNYKVTPIA